ncbi:hypothetical protein VTJ04DRAFT_9186 [Mycothermus thermophilus]|uniref:uncharacterized protein n=1 Tax=Humicola insolens TaxID=85995 RepID=UPI0037444027
MESETAPSHDEIWDDSALVNSWNEALEEYKKYHSIHLRGGNIDEILDQENNISAGAAKHETIPAGQLDDQQQVHDVDKDDAIEEEQHETAHPPISDVQPSGNAGAAIQSGEKAAAAAAMPSMGPQTLLGNVQDEELKKLLMSWYYAGYYTGLYEGRQQGLKQAEQAQKEKSG